jgi:predicted permease
MLAEDPAHALAEAGRGSVRRYRIQDAIVVFEIALALVLLAGASLFAETVRRMGTQALGFVPSNLVVITVRAPRSMTAGVSPAALAARTAGIVERLAAVPGVVSAAGTASAPFGGYRGSNPIEIEGKKLDPPPSARREIVTEDFFRTMRIPVLRGRVFDSADSSAARLAIVSDDFERRYMDGQALGRRFRVSKEMVEIIGVVPNMKDREVTDEVEPTFFVLSRQLPTWSVNQYVVRSAGDPGAVMAQLAGAVRGYDHRLLVSTLDTMDTLIERSMAEQRYRALLSTVFGAAALMLCATGVYALFARQVTDRRREIGLRIALGARPAAVLRQIVGRGLVLVATGLALGVPAALAAAELIRSLLFGIAPGAPGLYLSIAAVLTLTGAVATLVPASRASRVDPSLLLRSE